MLELEELLLGLVNNGGRGQDNSTAWLCTAHQTWAALKCNGQNGAGGVFGACCCTGKVLDPCLWMAFVQAVYRHAFFVVRCPDITHSVDKLLGAPLSLGKISRSWLLSAELNGTVQRCHPSDLD